VATILSTDPVDLLLDSNGQIVIQNGDLALVSGAQGVLQGIRIACLLVRGEWFLNLDTGVPYFNRDGVDPAEVIMGNSFDQLRATAAYRDAINSVPGVGSIDSLTVTYDPVAREITVAFQVTCTFGDVVANSLTMGM
jgi:hypothetical protein